MSGLLVAYLLLRELERNKGKFNVALYYVHRYLRLTPVYALIICLIATFMFYMGTGPNWYTVNYYSKSCRANWWMNIFYGKTPAVVFIGYLSCNLYSHDILRTVNNFFPTDEYVVRRLSSLWLVINRKQVINNEIFYSVWVTLGTLQLTCSSTSSLLWLCTRYGAGKLLDWLGWVLSLLHAKCPFSQSTLFMISYQLQCTLACKNDLICPFI